MINSIVQKMKINVVKSLTQPGHTLDIGCGDKRYTKHMPNPVGIDMNKTFENRKNTPDYWMDARDMEFGNETFDNVCALDTLEHIPEVDLVVKQAWRVLKTNGVMVIVDPNDDVLFWTRLLCGRFVHALRGNPGHVHKFNKDRLVELTSPFFKLEKVMRRGIFTGYRFRRNMIGS